MGRKQPADPAEELRELVREAHGAARDLRLLIAEERRAAQDAERQWNDRAQQIEARFTEILDRQIDAVASSVMTFMSDAIDEGTRFTATILENALNQLRADIAAQIRADGRAVANSRLLDAVVMSMRDITADDARETEVTWSPGKIEHRAKTKAPGIKPGDSQL